MCQDRWSLVDPVGNNPTTSRVRTECSVNWARGPKLIYRLPKLWCCIPILLRKVLWRSDTSGSDTISISMVVLSQLTQAVNSFVFGSFTFVLHSSSKHTLMYPGWFFFGWNSSPHTLQITAYFPLTLNVWSRLESNQQPTDYESAAQPLSYGSKSVNTSLQR
jgi:hypothetical protein